ncbi:MAG TPA: hypothetical protein PK180_08715 [Kiritimatiellia bacterium]|jgi:hypothetical protein|nr:hypothetical protein [Verrucomicrobiota bacterium]OQC68330.1 MAG: hypothetical protein BWX48_00090 [Verrucomicrobia bacterium ADurb.Bin006]HQG75363.1 hypothetical protein [Kiritimatiellia bacterium]
MRITLSLLSLVLGLTFSLPTGTALAQGTAFTYQGILNDGGNPANGSYDLRLIVYDALTGGAQKGNAITTTATAVSNGLFTVTLDPGAGVFDGSARWLEIAVRTNGDTAFTTLTPRQQLTPAPYALYAGTSSDVTAGSVVKSLNSLKDNVTLAAGSNVVITPSGNTLTIASAGAGGSGIWSLNGSNAYYATGNVGIGTTTPPSRLDVVGNWNGQYGALQLAGDKPTLRFTGGPVTGNSSWLLHVGNDAGNLGFYRKTGATWSQVMALTTNGHVGINTTIPNNNMLEIAGQNALGLVGYNPFLTFYDDNAGYAKSRIQGVGGDLNLFTESYMNGSNPFSFLKLANSGNVGIGSSAPVGKLEVVGQDAVRLIGYNPFLTFYDDNAGYAKSRIQGVGGDLNLFTESYMNGSKPFSFLKLANSGNVGIGSSAPVGKLEVVGQDAVRLIGYQPFLTFLDDNAGYARSRIQGVGGDLFFEAESYVNGANPNNYMKLSNSGNVSVKNITIRGGADVAEPFEFSAAEAEVVPGSVVIIDDEHPGKLRLSTHAYDTRVAGIVSGANGVNPGISLHQEGVLEGSRNVALSGRVYVLADAANGPIRAGDLLTTSETPGCAMKVTDHARAQGAILGKAMTGLKAGTGTVLVLVSLQ